MILIFNPKLTFLIYSFIYFFLFQIVVVPDAVFDLQKFTLDLIAIYFRIWAKLDTPSSPAPSSPAEPALSTRTISCFLHQPNILLPLSPEDPFTPCLSLCTNLQFKMDSYPYELTPSSSSSASSSPSYVLAQDIDMKISGLQIWKEGLKEEEEKREKKKSSNGSSKTNTPTIHNINAHNNSHNNKWKELILCPAKMTYSSSSIPTKQRIMEVEGGHFDFSLSYNDLRMILQLYNTWMKEMNNYYEGMSPPSPSPSPSPSSSPSRPPPSPSPSPSRPPSSPSPSPSRSSSPSSQDEVETVFEESFTSTFKFLGVTLIDDSHHAVELRGELPLLRFCMEVGF